MSAVPSAGPPAIGTAAAAPLPGQSGERLLSLLHLRHMRGMVMTALIVQFLLSALVGGAMLMELPPQPVLLWLALLWSALAARAVSVQWIHADAAPRIGTVGQGTLMFTILLLGAAWGGSLLLFPVGPETSFAEKLLVYVLIAVAGAGSILHAPQPRIARAFVLAVMVPAMAIRCVAGSPQDRLLVGAAAVYVTALFGLIRYLQEIVSSGFRAQNENAELARRLEQEAQQRLAIMEQTLWERRRMERELAEREQELRTLMDNLPDVVVRFDLECRRIYVSPSFEALAGVSRERALGTRPTDHCSWDEAVGEAYERKLREVIAGGAAGELTIEWHGIDGRQFSQLVSMVPEFDTEGRLASVLTVARDIGEIKRAEALLHAREEAFRSLAENTPDAIARFDRDLRLIYVNPALVAQSGISAAQLLGMRPADFVGRDWSPALEARLRETFAAGAQAGFEMNWASPDGARCTHLRLVPERDRGGEIASVLAVGRDITEIDGYRRRIATLAFYDPMTGLANRLLLSEQAESAIREGARHGRTVALMLLDLDRFKTINDTLGHWTGDRLLKDAATRLLGGVRASDTVARLGGDEFAVLLPEIRDGADAGHVAHKLLQALGEPFAIDGRELFVSASIGVALYPDDGLSCQELLKHADSAMYFAKARGRNNFQFYRAEMTRDAEERLHIEARLRKALAKGEFCLHYQPLVSLADGALVGAEVLLRWNNDELGQVSPDRFIAIAEDTGLIIDIGAWVLREACQTATAWNGRGHALRISVNLSTRQFRSRELVYTVLDTAAVTRCRPEWLELEITESLLLEDSVEVHESMADLRSCGFRFAMDDFGTGYSALGYLRRFPIDTIKIDRSFIPGITTDGHGAALVRAIISMAEALHLGVVAEGVETDEQRHLLRAWGGGRLSGQGELFGEAVSRAEFERLYLHGAGWSGKDSVA